MADKNGNLEPGDIELEAGKATAALGMGITAAGIVASGGLALIGLVVTGVGLAVRQNGVDKIKKRE